MAARALDPADLRLFPDAGLVDHPGEQIPHRELGLHQRRVVAALLRALLADVIFRLLVVHDLREVHDSRPFTAKLALHRPSAPSLVLPL